MKEEEEEEEGGGKRRGCGGSTCVKRTSLQVFQASCARFSVSLYSSRLPCQHDKRIIFNFSERISFAVCYLEVSPNLVHTGYGLPASWRIGRNYLYRERGTTPDRQQMLS